MSELEARLAALEERNQALQERIGELESGVAQRGPAPGHSSIELADAKVDRRSLLRNLGGAAAAGVGLFAVQSAAAPGPASAASGDAVILGAINTSDTNDATSIGFAGNTNATGLHALVVENTDSGGALEVRGGNGVAGLTLAPQGGASVFGNTGGLRAAGDDTFVDLEFFHSGDSFKTETDSIVGTVLTTAFAQYVDYPATFPVRAVETRTNGKKNHPDGSGALTGEYTIDISSELPAGVGGIMASITCIPQNNAAGFLRLWETGTQPGTANLAWSGGQIETTAVQTAVTVSGTFKIFVSGLAHVVLDLVAVTKNA